MKIIYCSKTIAAYDLKVGSYTELNDLMKLHEYQRSGSLFDIPKRCHTIIKDKPVIVSIVSKFIIDNIPTTTQVHNN